MKKSKILKLILRGVESEGTEHISVTITGSVTKVKEMLGVPGESLAAEGFGGGGTARPPGRDPSRL